MNDKLDAIMKRIIKIEKNLESGKINSRKNIGIVLTIIGIVLTIIGFVVAFFLFLIPDFAIPIRTSILQYFSRLAEFATYLLLSVLPFLVRNYEYGYPLSAFQTITLALNALSITIIFPIFNCYTLYNLAHKKIIRSYHVMILCSTYLLTVALLVFTAYLNNRFLSSVVLSAITLPALLIFDNKENPPQRTRYEKGDILIWNDGQKVKVLETEMKDDICFAYIDVFDENGKIAGQAIISVPPNANGHFLLDDLKIQNNN